MDHAPQCIGFLVNNLTFVFSMTKMNAILLPITTASIGESRMFVNKQKYRLRLSVKHLRNS